MPGSSSRAGGRDCGRPRAGTPTARAAAARASSRASGASSARMRGRSARSAPARPPFRIGMIAGRLPALRRAVAGRAQRGGLLGGHDPVAGRPSAVKIECGWSRTIGRRPRPRRHAVEDQRHGLGRRVVARLRVAEPGGVAGERREVGEAPGVDRAVRAEQDVAGELVEHDQDHVRTARASERKRCLLVLRSARTATARPSISAKTRAQARTEGPVLSQREEPASQPPREPLAAPAHHDVVVVREHRPGERRRSRSSTPSSCATFHS